jgi:hypothetical protein
LCKYPSAQQAEASPPTEIQDLSVGRWLWTHSVGLGSTQPCQSLSTRRSLHPSISDSFLAAWVGAYLAIVQGALVNDGLPRFSETAATVNWPVECRLHIVRLVIPIMDGPFDLSFQDDWHCVEIAIAQLYGTRCSSRLCTQAVRKSPPLGRCLWRM